MVKRLRSSDAGVHVTGAMATVFVCPFDGIVAAASRSTTWSARWLQTWT